MLEKIGYAILMGFWYFPIMYHFIIKWYSGKEFSDHEWFAIIFLNIIYWGWIWIVEPGKMGEIEESHW